MRTICAWCLALIKAGDDGPNAPVSHGLCESCAKTSNWDNAVGRMSTNKAVLNG